MAVDDGMTGVMFLFERSFKNLANAAPHLVSVLPERTPTRRHMELESNKSSHRRCHRSDDQLFSGSDSYAHDTSSTL
jgi:hypothetical protein